MFDSVLNTPLCKELRNKSSYMKNIKLYGPILWMGPNCLKDAKPLRGDSLLFTTQFPGVPGTHLLKFAGRKGWNNLNLEATRQI